MAESGPAGGGPSRRERRRRPVMWAGTVEQAGQPWSCAILNLSATGAKIRTDGPLTVRHPVTLICPRFGAIPAEVVWRDGPLTGLRFRELPAAAIAALASALPDFPQPPLRLAARARA